MRILSIRPVLVAKCAAILYGVLGLQAFVMFAISSAPYLVLPLGIVGFIFHLNFNFAVPRPSDPISFAFVCAGCISSYTASGWITGVAGAFALNAISRWKGGFDGSFITVLDENPAPQQAPYGHTPSPHTLQ